MISQILPFLKASIPYALAVKGLEKVDPRMKNFFTQAAAAGWGANEALDFLRNKFEGSGNKNERSRLETGSEKGTLRPDEAAGLAQIEQRERPMDLAQKGLAGAVGIGAALAGRENKTDSPKERNDQSEQQSLQPIERVPDRINGTAFAKFIAEFPALGKFLDEGIAKGIPIAQLVASGRQKRLLKGQIQHVEEKMGQSLEDLLAQITGGSKQMKPDFKNPSPEQGGGDAALLAALEKVLKM